MDLNQMFDTLRGKVKLRKCANIGVLNLYSRSPKNKEFKNTESLWNNLLVSFHPQHFQYLMVILTNRSITRPNFFFLPYYWGKMLSKLKSYSNTLSHCDKIAKL